MFIFLFGELQCLCFVMQLYFNFFGVVYVLDEFFVGLYFVDIEVLFLVLENFKWGGNFLFVVEYDLDVICCVDWLVDVGLEVGEKGGEIFYSGLLEGLKYVFEFQIGQYFFVDCYIELYMLCEFVGWLELNGVICNNLDNLDVCFLLGVMILVMGVLGLGKFILVSQVLVDVLVVYFGQLVNFDFEDDEDFVDYIVGSVWLGGDLVQIIWLVWVDQKLIGCILCSNMVIYMGFFDQVCKLFVVILLVKKCGYNVGCFFFNVKGGCCEYCQGEGWVMVELLFLFSVYVFCLVCYGICYNVEMLEVEYCGKNIVDVLVLMVDEVYDFFVDESVIFWVLDILCEVGLGYLWLG